MKRLEEDIDLTKDLMNIVNFSDIQDSGTWDSKVMTALKDGAVKYYYHDGKFLTDHPGGRKSPKVFYLSPGSAKLLNSQIELTRQKGKEYKEQLSLFNELSRQLLNTKIPISY